LSRTRKTPRPWSAICFWPFASVINRAQFLAAKAMLVSSMFDLSDLQQDATAWMIQAPAARDQEGRILAALGQLRGPLPRVALKWLVQYYSHLARTLFFPFQARCPVENGTLRPWTAVISVMELVPPATTTRVEDSGLLCKARRDGALVEVPLFELEVAAGHVNSQLIEDYWYWFWNWRFDPRI